MVRDSLTLLFERDLNKLKDEIDSYKNEASLWKVDGDIKNCGGNLCMHLTNNLRHFIGYITGGFEFKRDREAEFALKNVSKAELLNGIDTAKEVVAATLNKMNEEDFAKRYPVDVFKKEMTTEFFFISLVAHLDYHLGQINYHRRLLDK